MYRFRHRRISLLLLPSAVRLATYSPVRLSQLIRPSASTCSARLASLLPPRLRRWRTVLPEEAGTGATPQRWAKDASLLSLSGLSPTATSSEAAVSVPTPRSEARAGTASDTKPAICSSSSVISSESPGDDERRTSSPACSQPADLWEGHQDGSAPRLRPAWPWKGRATLP